MTAAPRRIALGLALVGAAAGCGVIPGPLPMWAADTLDAPEMERPQPAPPAVPAKAVRAKGTKATKEAKAVVADSGSGSESEFALLPDQPAGYAGADGEATAWVEEELRDRGLRFGTDGTVGSLFTYVRARHALVSTAHTRTGDVLFFDLGGRNRCGDHAGVVDQVDADGRIAFRESRGGVVRLSYAHPGQPYVRRGVDGRVLNTFLRIRREDDPPDARYLAGAMLCAVGRVDRPPRARPRQRMRVSGL
jgi:hypothetical protein